MATLKQHLSEGFETDSDGNIITSADGSPLEAAQNAEKEHREAQLKKAVQVLERLVSQYPDNPELRHALDNVRNEISSGNFSATAVHQAYLGVANNDAVANEIIEEEKEEETHGKAASQPSHAISIIPERNFLVDEIAPVVGLTAEQRRRLGIDTSYDEDNLSPIITPQRVRFGEQREVPTDPYSITPKDAPVRLGESKSNPVLLLGDMAPSSEPSLANPNIKLAPLDKDLTEQIRKIRQELQDKELANKITVGAAPANAQLGSLSSTPSSPSTTNSGFKTTPITGGTEIPNDNAFALTASAGNNDGLKFGKQRTGLSLTQ